MTAHALPLHTIPTIPTMSCAQLTVLRTYTQEPASQLPVAHKPQTPTPQATVTNRPSPQLSTLNSPTLPYQSYGSTIYGFLAYIYPRFRKTPTHVVQRQNPAQTPQLYCNSQPPTSKSSKPTPYIQSSHPQTPSKLEISTWPTYLHQTFDHRRSNLQALPSPLTIPFPSSRQISSRIVSSHLAQLGKL